MKIVAVLALVLLVATPAYATTTGLPPIPPSDRVESSHDEASTSANASTAPAILAPNPVATRGLVFQNLWTTDDGSETHFRYTLLAGSQPAISYIRLPICMARYLPRHGQTG